MATIASLNVDIAASTKNLEKGLKSAEFKLKKQAARLNGLANSLSTSITLPIVAFLGKSAQLADIQEEALSQIEAGIKSTGGAAGLTSKQLQTMASDLQAVTRFGDEEILSKVTSQLLTFTNIAGPEFERTQKAILDVSTRLKIDLKSASIQVGKALNDPIAGITSLTRSGITFSEGQKAMIHSFTKAGKAAEAHGVILNELERQFGGSAEAAAKSGAGGIKQFQNAMGDVMEMVGSQVLPILSEWAKSLTGMFQKFSNLSESTKKWAVNIALMLAAIGPAIKMIAIYKNALIALNTAKQVLLATGSKLATNFLLIAEKFVKMSALMKATTIGAIVVVVAALAIAFNHLSNQMTEAQKVAKVMTAVNVDAQKAILGEKLEAERLTKVLTDETATRKEKERALIRLKGINSDYFGGLKIEKGLVIGADKALQGYNESLLKNAKIKAAENQLIKLNEELLDVQMNMDKSDPSVYQTVGNFILSGGNAASFAAQQMADLGDNYKESTGLLNAKIKAMEDFLKVSKLSEGAGSGGGGGGGSTTATDIKAAAAGETVDSVLQKLEKSYQRTDNRAKLYGETVDTISEKSTAVEGAISSLLDMGLTPQNEAVRMLQERWANLNTTLTTLPESFSLLSIETMPVLNSAIDGMATKVQSLSTVWQELGTIMADVAGAASASMEQLAASGTASYKALGKAAIKSAADVVRANLMAYVSNVIKSVGLASGPLGAFLGPAAGAVAGVAFNKVLQALKIPAFADGGVVNKATLAMIGEAGTEYVIPEKKLPQMAAMVGKMRGGGSGKLSGEVKWNGRDFFIALKEIERQMQRTGAI